MFVWGGLGRATGNDFDGRAVAQCRLPGRLRNAARLRRRSSPTCRRATHFSHRIDTLQLGWAPYAHDYDTLATWIVVQGRPTPAASTEGTETALLLRLFKGGTWVEVGATTDGKLQAMAMFNF